MNVKDGSIVNDCGLFPNPARTNGVVPLTPSVIRNLPAGRNRGFIELYAAWNAGALFVPYQYVNLVAVKPAVAARVTRLELFTTLMVVLREALSAPAPVIMMALLSSLPDANDPEAAVNTLEPISLAPSAPVVASPFAPKSVTGVNPSGCSEC
jgi:hypothetical protein